jgi:hypothetical protein
VKKRSGCPDSSGTVAGPATSLNARTRAFTGRGGEQPAHQPGQVGHLGVANIETGIGLRDPSNTSDHLRDAFDDAGYEWVTSHVYRKTVATLMDEAGLSARQVADQLGQADITTTQRHYLGRTKIARNAARVLDAIEPRDGNQDD